MQNLIAIITLTVITSSITLAQNNFAEARWSKDNLYGYGDLLHTNKDGQVVEIFLVQVPGQTQGYAGAGHQFKLGKIGTVSAMGYGVIGSNNQLGAMAAVLPNIEWKRLKASAFLGYFVPVRGQVHQYLVLDPLDVTVALSKKFDIGTSVGFFLQDRKFNPQVGPVFKVNDKHGAWFASYRRGTGSELRFGRTIIW